MEALFSQQRLQHTESAVVDIILWVAVLDGVLYYMCSIFYQFSALYIFDSNFRLLRCRRWQDTEYIVRYDSKETSAPTTLMT